VIPEAVQQLAKRQVKSPFCSLGEVTLGSTLPENAEYYLLHRVISLPYCYPHGSLLGSVAMLQQNTVYRDYCIYGLCLAELPVWGWQQEWESPALAWVKPNRELSDDADLPLAKEDYANELDNLCETCKK
jgi:hypothetical protein